MKQLMLGNKAFARGLYEAGCCVVSSYPGTPSTDVTEEAAKFDDIYCEWAANEKVAMETAGSPWAALQGAAECVRTQWYAWQGTYTSVFFMTLTPLIWGEEFYFIGPVFIITFLAFSIFVLVKVLVMLAGLWW